MTVSNPLIQPLQSSWSKWSASVWQTILGPKLVRESQEKQQQYRLFTSLVFLLVSFYGFGTGYGIVNLPSGRTDVASEAIILGSVTAVLLFSYGLVRAGKYQVAVSLTMGILSISVFMAIIGSGISTPGVFENSTVWLLIPILLGATFFSYRGLVIFYAMNVISLSVLAQIGQVEAATQIQSIGVIMLTGGLLLIVTAHRNRLETTHLAEINEQADSLKHMGTLLEKEVTLRTQDLKLATELGQRISSLRQLDQLLSQAVDMIRAWYDLYYVQVYLLDQSGLKLNLHSGTGEAGAELMRRGHTLLVGPGSVNGTAAGSRTPVVIANTLENATFLPNTLLPETRSEAAIPLIAGDKLVGVLNLQGARANQLSPQNMLGLEVLAGQLAVSIENALLLAEVTNARTELEAQANKWVQKGWADYLDGNMQKEHLGYTYFANEISSFDEPLLKVEGEQTLWKAISVSGEAVGAIQINLDGSSDLVRVEDVIEAVSTQVAQQIENIRLISQADQYRAEAEKAARRLTREAWQDYLDTLGDDGQGYLYNQVEIKAIDKKPDFNGSAVEYPITLRGASVGELVFDGVETWDEEAQSLVEEVSKQLSAQLETIRLFEEAERRGIQLQTRSKELEASQRVTFAASEVVDLEALFNQVVNLIRDQFDLYHVQVYTVDEEKGAAVLRESTGYAGTQLLQRGHQIPLENTSLVTKSIRTGEPVLVANVAEDENFLPNALLPYTQSELVLPLKARGQSLGALDLQSRRIDQFTPETRNLFRQMAEQISLIIERTYARSELENLVSLQQATFDSTADGILAVDLDGNILSYNQKFVEMWNIPAEVVAAKDDSAALGAVIDKLVAPQDFIARVQDLYAHPTESAENELILLKDGRVFERYTQPQYGQDDHVLGRVWSFRDITEREMAAKELRESLAVRETLYAGSSRIVRAKTIQDVLLGLVGSTSLQVLDRISLLLFDVPWQEKRPDGMFVAAVWENSTDIIQAPVGTRYPMEQMPFVNHVNRDHPTIIEDVYEDDRMDAFTKTLFQKLGTKGLIIIPVLVAGEWIGVITAQSKAKISFTQENIRHIVSLVDQAAAVIQNHRLYEQAIRRAAELEAVAQLGTLATVQVDIHDLLQTIVTQTQERFALSHAEMYLWDAKREGLSLTAATGEVGQQMMASKFGLSIHETTSLVAQVARTRQGEFCNNLPNAPTFVVPPLLTEMRSMMAIPLLTADGLLGVLAVYVDTLNRFSEEDLRIKMVLGAQIVATYENTRLFTEIQQAAQRLKEVDRLKSEFLANMSHELRTPLNSVIGYSEVLLMGIDGELSTEAQTDIQAIFDNGRHLLSLINDVLDLAKIEAGRIVLNKKKESVVSLFDQAKTNNIGLLHKLKKAIEIKTEIAADIPAIYVDPTRTVQIIGNLISNAIKYSDKGIVTLRGFHQDDWLNIEVEDQGIGIAEEDLPKVFDQFTQLDMSSTRKVEGTGLGLSITRHLVEMHGGTISVESEVGVGSTFKVRLPIIEANGHHKNGAIIQN